MTHELVRVHAHSVGDLLDGDVTQVVAEPQRRQDFAEALVTQLQVLVLSWEHSVAVTLQEVAHIARPNR